MTVATALAVSWKPLMNSKKNTKPKASISRATMAGDKLENISNIINAYRRNGRDCCAFKPEGQAEYCCTLVNLLFLKKEIRRPKPSGRLDLNQLL